MGESAVVAVDPGLEGSFGPPVGGSGPIPANIVVVGEAPGQEEERLRVPFVGPAGQVLEALLKGAGLERDALYITNAVKRRPLTPLGETRTPTAKEVAAWAPSLLAELQVVQPKYVLVLGNVALKALYPDSRTITKVRGAIRQHPGGFQTLATFHPAALLRRRELLPIVESDLGTFGRLLRGEDSKETPTKHCVVRTLEALGHLRDLLLAAPEFAFDLETRSFDWMTEPILTIAFSTQPGEAYVVPLVGQNCSEVWPAEVGGQVRDILQEILGSEVPKGGQNVGFDLKFLKKHGFTVRNVAFDTLVEHHLLDENLPHDLKFLASYELGKPSYDDELRSYLPKTDTTFDVVPEKVLWKYTACDVDYTMTIHQRFTQRLQETNPKGLGYYKRVLVPLACAVANMEMRGVVVDEAWLRAAKEQYQAEADELRKKIFEAAGYELNLGSTKQLRELFYEKRGHRPVKVTAKGNASTDDESLKALAEQDPIAAKLQTYRTRTKHISTFLDGPLERRGPDGRIHPHYSITGTVTWRLSCRDPNLQNVPDDQLMRGGFCAPSGHYFAGSDYSQIELLVLAALARETRILELYKQGADLHTLIASYVLGIPPEEVTSRVRFIIKTIVFGINYGRGPGSIAKALGISYEDAVQLINEYFTAFPRIPIWREEQKRLARAQGYVESVFGFRRHLNFAGADEETVAELERQAVNSPVQGTAAAITNTAHVQLESMYQSSQLRAIPAMTLHDAIFFYVPVDGWEGEIALIKEVMERPVPELGVAPRVNIVVGERWGDDSLLNTKKASMVPPREG